MRPFDGKRNVVDRLILDMFELSLFQLCWNAHVVHEIVFDYTKAWVHNEGLSSQLQSNHRINLPSVQSNNMSVS